MDKKKLTQEEINALSPRARKAYENSDSVISEILVENPNKDVEIDFDIMDYNLKNEVHDTSVLESYATGKKVKSRGTGKVSDPYEGYSPDLKADDYAKGGLANYDNYLPGIDNLD